MVKRRPIKDQGLTNFRNFLSYHSGLARSRIGNRMILAAPRGTPKKTATVVAIVEYNTSIVSSDLPVTLMNRIANGPCNTICSTQLIATRIAPY